MITAGIERPVVSWRVNIGSRSSRFDVRVEYYGYSGENNTGLEEYGCNTAQWIGSFAQVLASSVHFPYEEPGGSHQCAARPSLVM